jgi:hypothetical protein
VSAAVGDNAELIAHFLGLSVDQLQEVRESLEARGLQLQESLADNVYALRITDSGIDVIETHIRRQNLASEWSK